MSARLPSEAVLRSGPEPFVVRLPPGLHTRRRLFAALGWGLRTPWSPTNWDGLWDFLTSLQWLDHERIEIIHPDPPLSAESERERSL